jgi:hypothetical protein
MKAVENGERRHVGAVSSVNNSNCAIVPVSDLLSHRAAQNVPPIDSGWKRYRLSHNTRKQKRFFDIGQL